jgi:hypothetical protein
MFSCSSSPEIATVQLDLGTGKKSKSEQKATTPSLSKKQSSSKTPVSKSAGLSGGDIASADSSRSAVVGKAAVASMLGSPKPKRTLFDGFKQTLRGKNSEGSNSSGAGRERDSVGSSNSAVGSPTSDSTPVMAESFTAGIGNNSRRNSDDNLSVSETGLTWS